MGAPSLGQVSRVHRPNSQESEFCQLAQICSKPSTSTSLPASEPEERSRYSSLSIERRPPLLVRRLYHEEGLLFPRSLNAQAAPPELFIVALVAAKLLLENSTCECRPPQKVL